MTQPCPTPSEIERAIRTIPDFPKPGIQFKDITPVLANARLFAGSIELLAGGLKPGMVDAVVGIDARGFIFAAAVAIKLQAGFVPVRKKGKLPFRTHEQEYDLEYGSDTLEMHVDAVQPGSRVLLVDDLLATGGTIDGYITVGLYEDGTPAELFLVHQIFRRRSARLGLLDESGKGPALQVQ